MFFKRKTPPLRDEVGGAHGAMRVVTRRPRLRLARTR